MSYHLNHLFKQEFFGTNKFRHEHFVRAEINREVMNQALWTLRKNYLYRLMLKLSNRNGGDKPQFLKECHKQVCELYPDDKIEEAIKYFEELASDMGIKYTDSVRR